MEEYEVYNSSVLEQNILQEPFRVFVRVLASLDRYNRNVTTI